MLIVPFLLTFVCLVCFPAQAENIRLDQGQIKGVAYILAIPPQWKGKLLLRARADGVNAPATEAPLDFRSAYSRTLLQQGWIIGTTSLTKSSAGVKGTKGDFNALWDYVAKKYGKPNLTFFYGEGQGARLAIGIAEQPESRYQGVLAVSLPPVARVSEKTAKDAPLHYHPQVPLLLLASSGGAKPSLEYVANAGKSYQGKCAVWTVSHGGEANLNDAEINDAFQALRRAVLQREKLISKNATRAVAFQASTAAYDQGGYNVEIKEIDPLTGTLTLGLQPRDLLRLNLRPRAPLEIQCGAKKVAAVYDLSPNAAAPGTYVLYLKADGWMLLAQKNGNAAQSLEVGAVRQLKVIPAPRAKTKKN